MSSNGIKLKKETDYFSVFPDPKTVFAANIEKHLEYFLPLASVDLSKINSEWSDTVHFIVPIEPYDGVVGETTSEFYTYYSRDNWIGFQNKDGLCEYEGDWRLFVKDTDFYQAAYEGYATAKKHFDKYKALHIVWNKPDKNGNMFDVTHPRTLIDQLGGECYDANWANMGNFNITRFGSWTEIEEDGQLDESQKVRPVTEDGRPFEYIGFVPSSYYNMNRATDYTWADAFLFYDPVSKITLTTFDWT